MGICITVKAMYGILVADRCNHQVPCILSVPRKMLTSLEKQGSALRSGKTTKYILLERKSGILDFETSFVKIG